MCPILFHRIHIRHRNPAMEMCFEILQILRFGTVNITRNIQIVCIFDLDLFIGYKTGILRICCNLLVECGYDFVNIPLAQAVLVSVFDIVMACIDHENALTVIGIGFVNNDNTSRNSRTVKEVGRQADNALDITLVDNMLAYGCLGIPAEEYTVRQNNCRFTRGFQGFKNVQEPCIIPVLFGRHITVTRKTSVIFYAVCPVFE